PNLGKATAEAGLVARGRVGVQNAFVDRVLNQRGSGREQRLGRGVVPGIKRYTQLADLVTPLRTVHPVELSSPARLPDALERRFMTCHESLLLAKIHPLTMDSSGRVGALTAQPDFTVSGRIMY